MDQHTSKAGWDVVLFGIPLIAFLIFGFFHLDEVFVSRKHQGHDHEPAAPQKESHYPSMHSDPDGHPWDDR